MSCDAMSRASATARVSYAVVQPIVRLTDMVVVGYEALSRVVAGV